MLDPIIFSLGPLSVRWYGLIYALGFVLAYWYLDLARKAGKLDLTKNDLYDLITYLVVGDLIGARLFTVLIWNPSFYLANPLKIFAIWEGGLSVHGGFIGVMIAAYIFCRKRGYNLWKIADVGSIPAIFGLALGRIANFINAEHVGVVTDVSWCVNFPTALGCRHPSQLYSAFARFVIFGLLYIQRNRLIKPGFLFWQLVALESIGRIITDFWRTETGAVAYTGLSVGQASSIVFLGVSIFVFAKWYKEDLKHLFRRSTS